MTTYKLGDEIYEDTFRRLVIEDVEVPEAFRSIVTCRAGARRARTEAMAPGFRAPIPGYIPAYGAEAEVRAIIDYCRLKRIMQRSPYFRSFATKTFDPERLRAENSMAGIDLDDEVL
jgi:hypothetical protein